MMLAAPTTPARRSAEKTQDTMIQFLPFRAAALVAALAVFGAGAPRGLAAQDLTSGQVEVQAIVVRTETEAEQVMARLKKGEDFAQLARAVSIDGNAGTGGSVRDVDPANLRPELRNALANMHPGDINGPIAVSGAFLILKLVRGSPAALGQGMGPNRKAGAAPGKAMQFPAEVAGQVLADMLFERYPKPKGWEQDLGEVCSVRKRSLAEGIAGLEDSLAHPAAGKSPEDMIQTHYALAQLDAYQGDMEGAVKEWESAYQVAVTSVPAGVPQLTEVLGVSYLQKSRMENGVFTDPGGRCIFPPQGSACFAQTSDSKRAIDHFTRYLQLKPEPADAVQVRWLLNLAYMTLGEYPEGVPAGWRIPPSAFQSEEKTGQFVDVAAQAGLNFVSMAGGVAVDDFENNGLLDIFVSSYDVCQPLRYFHNNGDGTFSDRTVQAGVAGELGGLNLIQGDYNNDGCMDLLVLRGAWEFPERKSLLRNNCDGTFTDVTQQAGLGLPATRTQAAVWADINNDGLLDLFVGSENGSSQLFLNKGDGTFEDISHASGVDRVAFTKGVTAGDYDHDGYVDFYVSNLYGGNFLYHNNHDNTFTDVSEQAGVRQADSQSFATWFFDYDNDGWPDLFVTGYYFSTDETIRSYLGLPTTAGTMRLYRNLGNGTFQDVTKATRVNRVNTPMGANFGDIENDGYPDIYLATGGPEYGAMAPKMLLRNHDGQYFADVTESSGTGDLDKGHGVAFADLGNNGNEDLLVSIGGATPGDAHEFRVFRNPGNGNDWITVKLVGVKSNRAGIGAQIHVTVQDGSAPPRSVYRTVGSGGSFGANPIEQHIGLGPHAKILKLEVWWPASNTRQSFTQVDANQFVEIREFGKTYTRLRRKSFVVGSSAELKTAASPELR
jgi:FG-GAP-like repeat/ASPIC and UnbV/PPIC-type PPIASE domain